MRAYYDADSGLALPQYGICSTKPLTDPGVQRLHDMRRLILLILVFSTVAFASGCVYRANISQGNLIRTKLLQKRLVYPRNRSLR